ncbi:MAG TPA: MASE1 domain-containing protein [Candidatus Acidoferrales bacterium]|nr:MASE1 domain-containing protein [Candidatus Acidoferrales bacterium]
MANPLMGRSRLYLRQKDLIAMAVMAAAYFAAGKLGLSTAVVHPSSTAVWPPSGIVLAALLILGPRVWPGVALGAFLVNITTAGSVWTSLAIAAGNTLEGLVGAYLVLRFANGVRCFDRVQDTLKFAFLAGPVSTAISSTMGATALAWAGFASWADYKPIWFAWWLGDQAGVLILGPLLLLWSANFRVRWSWSRLGEFSILLALLAITGQIIFGPVAHRSYPLEYLSIPFLVWAALRFGPREATTVSLVLSGIAVRGTLHGFGPFAVGTKDESLLLLQTFMSIVAVMTLTLAVLTAERMRAEEQILNLAVTDPLTGLANYRKLLEVIDLEIKRFGRTGRPFSILLIDMDGLKAINDGFGHLIGSQALCRLGHILRVHCRDIDTAGRYGGDEFVLVIPETGRKQAQQVAERIQQRVLEDDERPAISVSFGTAVYPRDGATRDELLEAADRALYQMKRRPLEQGRTASREGGSKA